jgi:ElaB/YqjD/DUF883 family membrane-anchored ribosome-binding protein
MSQSNHPDEKKDPREIEREIEQTRSVISQDLNAIGERLSPENLKQDLKREAKEMVDEAKEAAIDRLREAKDSALESVEEVVHDVGQRAREIGDRSMSFVRANPIPLAMIGLGVGWLAVSVVRNRRNRRNDDFDFEGDLAFDMEERPYDLEERGYSMDQRPRRFGALREKAEHLREGARHKAEHLREEASHGIEQVRDKARDLGHRAQTGLRQAQTGVSDYAHENPLAIGALAIAAGVGFGLLLPASRKEDQLMGGMRDRLVTDVRESAREVTRSVKDTAQELKQTLGDPLRG